MTPIEPLSPAALPLVQPPAAAGPAPARGFAQALARALEDVSAQQHAAARAAERFQMGDAEVTLEETMIAMQKANLSFQAVVQVRNKLLAAYHDIMNMQV